MHNSNASYETLKILEKQKIIKLELIFKRVSAKENCVSNERKFIAIFKKT